MIEKKCITIHILTLYRITLSLFILYVYEVKKKICFYFLYGFFLLKCNNNLYIYIFNHSNTQNDLVYFILFITYYNTVDSTIQIIELKF